MLKTEVYVSLLSVVLNPQWRAIPSGRDPFFFCFEIDVGEPFDFFERSFHALRDRRFLDQFRCNGIEVQKENLERSILFLESNHEFGNGNRERDFGGGGQDDDNMNNIYSIRENMLVCF